MTDFARTVALLCTLCIALPLFASQELQPTITVTGEGIVTAVPDQATVTTGVETRAASPTQALAENSTAVEALLTVLSAGGIEPRDIQTSGLGLSPQYQHPRDGNGEPTVTGYVASNQLRVRVRDLDRLGPLLDALVKAGSNRLSGIEFGHSGMDKLVDQARSAAVVEAQRRARLYAEAAGARVGPVISITELGRTHPQPMYRMATAMDMAAAPPVAAGEQQVQASVQVVFSLVPE